MHQSIIVLDTSNYHKKLLEHIEPHLTCSFIEYTEIELIYDWCMMRALNDVCHIKVQGAVHNLEINDFYRIIYEKVGMEFMLAVEYLINENRIFLLANEKVKALVTFNTLIIVRTFF